MAYTLEELQKKHSGAVPRKVFTAQDLKERHSFTGLGRPEEEQEENLGTGFTPTFEREKGDGVVKSAFKTLGNVPRSGFEFGKNIASAVFSPIQTGKAVIGLAKGTGAKAVETGLEKTDVGQAILERISQTRVKSGLQPLQRNETGALQAVENEDIQAINAVGSYFKDRYGGIENFKESAIEDPVGVLADVAGLVSGAGSMLRGAGTASKLSGLTRAGKTLTKAGQVLEPTSLATRGVSGLRQTLRGTTAVGGQVMSDVGRSFLPTSEKLIAQATELSPGDIRTIQKKTGQNVSDFIIKNIDDASDITPEDIAIRMEDIRTNNYNEVRNRISSVDKTFTKTDIPRANQALDKLSDLYKDVPGLEDLAREVDTIRSSEQFTLSDIQRVKELLDDAELIFSRSGDVKAGVASKGLANIRKDLKGFIENEVPDVAELNNRVQTSFEIQKAIQNRATKGLTRNMWGVSDVILGGFAFGGGAGLVPTAGIILAKKALESPAFRISLAKQLSKLGDSKAKNILTQIKNNNVSARTQRLLIDTITQAQDVGGLGFPVIENIQEIGEQINEQ